VFVPSFACENTENVELSALMQHTDALGVSVDYLSGDVFAFTDTLCSTLLHASRASEETVGLRVSEINCMSNGLGMSDFSIVTGDYPLSQAFDVTLDYYVTSLYGGGEFVESRILRATASERMTDGLRESWHFFVSGGFAISLKTAQTIVVHVTGDYPESEGFYVTVPPIRSEIEQQSENLAKSHDHSISGGFEETHFERTCSRSKSEHHKVSEALIQSHVVLQSENLAKSHDHSISGGFEETQFDTTCSWSKSEHHKVSEALMQSHVERRSEVLRLSRGPDETIGLHETQIDATGEYAETRASAITENGRTIAADRITLKAEISDDLQITAAEMLSEVLCLTVELEGTEFNVTEEYLETELFDKSESGPITDKIPVSEFHAMTSGLRETGLAASAVYLVNGEFPVTAHGVVTGNFTRSDHGNMTSEWPRSALMDSVLLGDSIALGESYHFIETKVFSLSGTFTPMATPSRSPRPSPSQSRYPDRMSVSMMESDFATVMETMSISVVEQVNSFMTLTISLVLFEETTFVESDLMRETDVLVPSVVSGPDGETSITQVWSLTMIPSETIVASQVASESITEVSMVVFTITYVEARMPVYATVVSKVVFMVGKLMTPAGAGVSNALLIGAITGGVFVLLAMAAVILAFARKQQSSSGAWGGSSEFNPPVTGRFHPSKAALEGISGGENGIGWLPKDGYSDAASEEFWMKEGGNEFDTNIEDKCIGELFRIDIEEAY
jgi:hypothetical protein